MRLMAAAITAQRQYIYNTAQWIVNKPSTESLLTGEGVLQTQTRYAYDGQLWGSVPVEGDLTETTNGAAALWVSARTGYDEWGNPIVVTDTPGRV